MRASSKSFPGADIFEFIFRNLVYKASNNKNELTMYNIKP